MHTPLDLTGVMTVWCLACVIGAALFVAACVASDRRTPRMLYAVLLIGAALFTSIGIVMGGLLWLFA